MSRFPPIVLPLVFGLMLVPLPASATGPAEIHVSPRGNDAQAGTPAEPLLTLGEAAKRAQPGSTVYVHAGTYHEPLVTRRAGRPDAVITFRRIGGPVTLDGARMPWAAGLAQNQGLIELNHAHTRVVGLKVQHSKNTGILLNADHVRVEGCEVAYAQRHGISTHTSRQERLAEAAGVMIRDVVIAGNRVHHCNLAQDRGIAAGQAISVIADGFVVRDNHVHDNRDIGIDLWLGARHGEVVGNRVHDNQAAGIYVDGAAFVRIHRNTSCGNQAGIGVSSEDGRYRAHHIWVYNNLLLDNRDAGAFLWNPAGRRDGLLNVLFAHNTLVDNRVAFGLSGRGHQATIVNNLGLNRGTIENLSWAPQLTLQSNLWLSSPDGFRNARGGDYRLKASSPAVDRGLPLSSLRDDQGRLYGWTEDFAGRPRRLGSAPDPGAFEYTTAE